MPLILYLISNLFFPTCEDKDGVECVGWYRLFVMHIMNNRSCLRNNDFLGPFLVIHK